MAATSGTRGYASVLQSILVPSFSEAHDEQDLVRNCAAYRRSCLLPVTLTTVTPAASMLGFAGRWTISVWAGNAAVPNSVFLWGCAFGL
jgi:hypothetical protein